jgi:hypothetical protein
MLLSSHSVEQLLSCKVEEKECSWRQIQQVSHITPWNMTFLCNLRKKASTQCDSASTQGPSENVFILIELCSSSDSENESSSLWYILSRFYPHYVLHLHLF